MIPSTTIGETHYATLKKLILASMILVPVIPFILILAIGYHYFTNALETITINSLKRVVGDHRHMIESFLSERKGDLEFILRSYSFRDLVQSEKLPEVFQRLQKRSNAFVDLGVFDEEGILVAYQGPFRLTGNVYREADWFKEVLRQGGYMSDIFLGYRRIPHFVIALAGEGEGKKWVLRATIDTYLFSDLVKKVRIGKTGEAYLLNTNGIFQTERRSGGGLMDKDPDNFVTSPERDGIRTFIRKDSKGHFYLYATTWLKDKKWLLVVRQEKADAFKALLSAAYLIGLITVIGGSAITGVAFYLTDRIVKRMKETDTEKDHLGQQLIRASRLAELGEMAAGFAHEINNPLQIIKTEQSLIETILSDLKSEARLKGSQDLKDLEDSLGQIKVQVDRCAKITQAILKFGRKSDNLTKDVSLQGLIPEVVAMIEKKAAVEGIKIIQKVDERTPDIHVDPAQLQQVLLNLFNNAIDAIIEKKGSQGGEMTITAAPEYNGTVEISVKDDGCGISPDNLNRIFLPFFTTKPVGKGTGLGLSVCYGIIENMGGEMDVISERNVGSYFKIALPSKGSIR